MIPLPSTVEMHEALLRCDAGYESDRGFRDAFGQLFGHSPRSADECLKTAMIDSPLGALIAVASNDALCLLEFADRRMLETQIDRLKRRCKMPITPGECPLLEQTKSEIAEYFRRERRSFDVKIEPHGSDFQLQVWKALVEIPFGETRSYGDLAAELGNPGSQRAVGRANGDNGIAIIVPCHRVIGADGTLTGYGGGLWRKRRLLELESGEPTLF